MARNKAVQNQNYARSVENVSEFEREHNTLTQEQIQQQIKSQLVPLSRQLEDLTELTYSMDGEHALGKCDYNDEFLASRYYSWNTVRQ